MDLNKDDTIKLNLGLPTSFGKVYNEDERNITSRLKQTIRKQYELIKLQQQQKIDTSKNIGENNLSDSEDDEFDEDDFNVDNIPVSHELILSGEHEKLISSISLDPSGARLLTASYDSTFKLWDFNTMDINNHHPFRSVEPFETYQLHSALFSPNGRQILVIPRYTKPKIYDRDGIEIAEFSSGDMYLVDMKNTKGHTAEITSGAWNPISDDTFVTSSSDSTVRVWDINNTKSQKDVIVVRSKGSRGNKVHVSRVAWLKNDLTTPAIIAGTDNGSIGLWDTRSQSTRPSNFIEDAHSHYVTAIVQRPLSQMFATRCLDGVINLWDSRQLKSPVLSRNGVKTISEESNVIFDPRPSTLGKYLLAGTLEGKVQVLDTSDLSTLMTIEDLAPNQKGCISSISWHEGLNQIITGSSNGQIHVLFSPDTSQKGALTSIEKVPRRKYADDENLRTVNITAAGLEADITQAREKQEEHLRTQKIKKNNERENSASSLKLKGNYHPDRNDIRSVGDNQNEGNVWNIPNKSYVRENVHLSELIHEDPREALLKYAEKAEKMPIFFKESDYNKRILAETDTEEKTEIKRLKK